MPIALNSLSQSLASSDSSGFGAGVLDSSVGFEISGVGTTVGVGFAVSVGKTVGPVLGAKVWEDGADGVSRWPRKAEVKAVSSERHHPGRDIYIDSMRFG